MGIEGGSLVASAELTGTQAVDPAMVLALPRARTAVLQHARQDDGSPFLTLFHGDKEVVFDDPRQFGFAEMLAKGAPFRAADAADWGGIGWEEARGLLDALMDEGVLVSADQIAPGEDRHDHKPMSSPLPPAPMTCPRSWPDRASLMLELTGSQLDMAYLEAVVPIFRTGHLFVDREGRQVGEANVFPAAARIDVPIDWRGCPYAGSRYQPYRPMNVTALRAMRVHWRQMMAMVGEVRSRYLTRFPDARSGWTVGHVERLTVSILALPSYVMLRRDAVPNGDLHPVLSNLFRVSDGVRMVMHQMLFLPLYEPMKHPDAPVSAVDILDYAERNNSFYTDHGVCAGPRFMIEDFLAVLLDGTAPRGGLDRELEPELAAALDLIDPAIDYAMLGLQTYGAVFSLWPAMTRAYEELHRLLAKHTASPDTAAGKMAQRFAGHFAALSDRSFLASEEWRVHREAVYDDMFARCVCGLTGSLPETTLSASIAPSMAAVPSQPCAALAAAIATHFGPDGEPLAQGFARIVHEFLACGQCIVRLAEQIQSATGNLLGRAAPSHRLTLQQLNLHNVLMGEDVRTVPFLPNELVQLLGIHIHVDADKIEIRERPTAASVSHSPDATSGG